MILGGNFVNCKVFRAYPTYRRTNSTKLIRPRSSTGSANIYKSSSIFSLWARVDKRQKYVFLYNFSFENDQILCAKCSQVGGGG